MTLQIKNTDRISGIPLEKVRGFFRYIVAWHCESFDLHELRARLSLAEEPSLALALALVHEGFVEPPENGAYKLTEKGHELVRASAAGNVTRKTAQDALAGLLERAEKYNCDEDKILAIEAIVVFGSFLGTKLRLGDLDVAVKYRARTTDGDRAQQAIDYAKQSGRYFGRIIDMLYWPSAELYQILKARKRTIKIQDWDTLLHLAVKSKEAFRYEVVFGNPAEVEEEIRRCCSGEQP